MQKLEERIVGLLLGLAAGDRIGGPVRMALRVAESLRDRSGLDVSDGTSSDCSCRCVVRCRSIPTRRLATACKRTGGGSLWQLI